jgi:hypothetical protein
LQVSRAFRRASSPTRPSRDQEPFPDRRTFPGFCDCRTNRSARVRCALRFAGRVARFAGRL